MNPLAQRIRDQILKAGPMPFSRFMELALYAPGEGYYEKQTEIGKEGDFYTSVSVGSLFGHLLARQFADWFNSDLLSSADFQSAVSQVSNLPNVAKPMVVEIGAHRGQFAADVLQWFKKHAPALFARLDYVIVEPSSARKEWQIATLSVFSDSVRWVESLDGVSGPGIEGIVFSNELLDAMPVHRLRWNAVSRDWDEWLVGVDAAGTNFVWQTGVLEPGLRDFCPTIPPELAAVLPEGFTMEVSPAAAQWWREAARGLERGYLVAFDYGLCAEEFLVPERRNGTLRAYSKHHVFGDVLQNPGEQDITAHVNFSAAQQAGELEGLETVSLSTQREFLTRIFERVVKNPSGFEPWTSSLIRQFQTLTHPEHLGRAFRVLVQKKGSA